MQINRRKTRQIKIRNVRIGGDAPITVQSMTSTPTKDIVSTLEQIRCLEGAGCDIVRLGIPDEESALAVADIRKETNIALVADIHFDYRLALIAIDAGIDALRINPGNLRSQEAVEKVVNACQNKGIPIRIGVNGGSIDRTKFPHPTPEALVHSALGHIKILEDLKFYNTKVSLKSSDVPSMIEAYRLFASQSDYPLHLGVTEAGGYEQAVIKSSIGMGSLLLEGIGDTLRVSITGDVVKEVSVGKTILRTLGIRKEGIEVISCPTCARKEYDVERAVAEFTEKTGHIKKYVRVAIMGCVVNGPGEAQDADIGVAVGKTGAVLFKGGQKIRTLKKEDLISGLLSEIENFN